MTRAQRVIIAAAGLLLLFLAGFIGLLVWDYRLPSAAQATMHPQILEDSTLAAIPNVTPSPQQVAVVPTLTPVLPSPVPGNLDPLACLPDGEGQTASVREILPDGSLRLDLGEQVVMVKLLGTQVTGSGGQALGLLKEMLEGKAVRLYRDAEDGDAAGRLLRYVLVGERFVNYELVRSGAALPELFPPGQLCTETLLSAEREARSAGLGYWSLRPEGSNTLSGLDSGESPPCDCAVAYQCGDFATRSDAQACYNACGDYRNISLDEDIDGLACENLP